MSDTSVIVRSLASEGLSPKEIEDKLGMKPYTIHMTYHKDLMEGYKKRTKKLESYFFYAARLAAWRKQTREKRRLERERKDY